MRGHRLARWKKLLAKVIKGESDANIPFEQLCNAMKRLGFDERIESSHHTFTKEDIPDILVLQKIKGEAKAKPYQVQQVRSLIEKYGLAKDLDIS